MIKLNELHAISLAASHEEARYNLNGVHIEKYMDGKHGLIATNGHIIAMLHLQPAKEIANSFTIPTDDIEILLFVARKYYAAEAKIDFENRKIELFNAEKSFFIMELKPIDRAYINFRNKIKDTSEATPSVAVQFNAKYLTVFGKIHEILRGSKTITILPISPSEQAIITFYDCPEFQGRVMPMRS
jgi:hypothetical protein